MANEILQGQQSFLPETDRAAMSLIYTPEVRKVLAAGGSFGEGNQPCYPGESERLSVVKARHELWPELFLEQADSSK